MPDLYLWGQFKPTRSYCYKLLRLPCYAVVYNRVIISSDHSYATLTASPPACTEWSPPAWNVGCSHSSNLSTSPQLWTVSLSLLWAWLFPQRDRGGGGGRSCHAIPKRSPKCSALEPSTLDTSYVFLMDVMIYIWLGREMNVILLFIWKYFILLSEHFIEFSFCLHMAHFVRKWILNNNNNKSSSSKTICL